jgi:hypothetical protein
MVAADCVTLTRFGRACLRVRQAGTRSLSEHGTSAIGRAPRKSVD